MAYIGRDISNLSDRVVLDNITASATATYNLLLNSVAFVPSSAESLTVSLNGVIQKPQSSYIVSGSTIVFDSALTSSDSIDFILAERAITLTTVGSGSVGTSQLSDSAVTTAKINDGAVTSAKLDSGVGLGKIGQVVSGTTTTSVSVSGNNVYVDTGLTASITPSATTSKVLVLISQAIFLSSNDGTSEQTSNYKLLRDSTNIFETPNNSDLRVTAEHAPNNELRIGLRQNLNILDTPSTTSAITYKTQLQKRSGVVSVAQDNNSPSHITLMEVLA